VRGASSLLGAPGMGTRPHGQVPPRVDRGKRSAAARGRL